MPNGQLPSGIQEILARLTASVSGLFKFGPGIMGKSAILLGLLFVGIIVLAIWPSPIALAAWALGAVAFFLWYFPMLRFARENPAQAMLDGAEWRIWKQFEITARQLPPSAGGTQPMFDPGVAPPALPSPGEEDESTESA